MGKLPRKERIPLRPLNSSSAVAQLSCAFSFTLLFLRQPKCASTVSLRSILDTSLMRRQTHPTSRRGHRPPHLALPRGRPPRLALHPRPGQGQGRSPPRHEDPKRFGGALEPATRSAPTIRAARARTGAIRPVRNPLVAAHRAHRYFRLAALQLVTEVLEEAMPDQASDDNIYRLGRSSQSLDRASRSETRPPVHAYFCLWMNRLMGWMPELGHCVACGLDLRGPDRYWYPHRRRRHLLRRPAPRQPNPHGRFRRRNLSHPRTPLADLATEAWPATRSADLRAFAIASWNAILNAGSAARRRSTR